MSQSFKSGDTLLTANSDFFLDGDFIYDPEDCDWVNAADCVWKGPDFLSCRTVLKPFYAEEDHLKSFFTATLKIGNATLETIIKELRFRRDSDQKADGQLEFCGKAYAYLESNAHSDEAWMNLR